MGFICSGRCIGGPDWWCVRMKMLGEKNCWSGQTTSLKSSILWSVSDLFYGKEYMIGRPGLFGTLCTTITRPWERISKKKRSQHVVAAGTRFRYVNPRLVFISWGSSKWGLPHASIIYQIKALILLATRRQSYFSHKNHHHITIKVPFQYCHAKTKM
jgi:hypothetical protein